MPQQRLQRMDYLRRLDTMSVSLHNWQVEYTRAAEQTPSEWLRHRFNERAAHIVQVRRCLEDAYRLLCDLPRLQ